MPADRRILWLCLGGLALIAAAACTAWFFANFERHPQTVEIGASAQARRNPFLAAARFLVRVGIPVESRTGRDLLLRPPPTTDTLVVNGLGPLNARRRAALRAWLEGGGRLVVEATDLWDRDRRADDFLGQFGIRLEKVKTATKDTPGLAKVQWGDGLTPLTVRFRPDWSLEARNVNHPFVVRANGHTHLVRQAVGAGWLTVTSDSEFLTNGHIGRHDHALFLAELARPAAGGKVWLLYDSAVPWLGALLWAAAPAALVAAAVLILVWAWSLGARLGPRAGTPDRRRRDLLEHLDAAAAFAWRHGRASQLVATTRRQVQGAWQRRRPELRHLGPMEQAAVIAKANARPTEVIARALQAQAQGVPGFIDQARVLQSLWEGTRPRRTGIPGAPQPRRPPVPISLSPAMTLSRITETR
ncbi:DUF4350 domain-containing protein [uncultured Thiodictyon sp.]|uniref:DUF4350 domain-containing protein n=1 Tax=uncultured Thiodictyon sp. TaxID=1846217 RepID=UPI0025DF68A9|nr:DUF4350 domain-containing protein [uncultured Thiodictyon sp.]